VCTTCGAVSVSDPELTNMGQYDRTVDDSTGYRPMSLPGSNKTATMAQIRQGQVKKRIRVMDHRMKVDPVEERYIKIINNIGDRFGLQMTIRNHTHTLIKRARKNGHVLSFNEIASLAYLACKEFEKPIDLINFQKYVEENINVRRQKVFLKAVQLGQELDINIRNNDINMDIYKFASTLGLGEIHARNVLRLYEKIREKDVTLLMGKKPIVIISAMYYIYLKQSGIQIRRTEVYRKAGISELSMRKTVRLINSVIR